MSERLFLRLPDDPPCAPETTVPPGTLRAFAVPAPLHSALAHVTAYEERFAPGQAVAERVLPDGASRLLITLTRGAASIHVAGASASPVVLTMSGHMHGLSVALQPGATLGLFGVPADALAGLTVPWEDLVPRAHRDQSHLINEFRALCGLTPQQFLQRVVSDSSNTTHDPVA